MEFAQSGEMALQRIADAVEVLDHLDPVGHQYAGDDWA